MKTSNRFTPFLLSLALVMSGSSVSAAEQDQINTPSSVDIKKVSETFGHFIGSTIVQGDQMLPLDLDSVIVGIRKGAEGKAAPMEEDEYQEAVMALQMNAHSKAADQNLKEANEFLNENRYKQNIQSLEDGKVQYVVLEEGNGNSVTAESSPSILYKGSFLDGKEFGNSEESGPITVPLDSTIPGFQKGLLGMKEGEKRRLFIHPDLGYGTSGQLPPNALLIFEVEVVEADTPEPSEK